MTTQPDWPTLQINSVGANVSALQCLLMEKGHSAVLDDGDYSITTSAIVRDHQKLTGLSETGVADAAFFPELIVTVSQGDVSEAAKAVQYLLNKFGEDLVLDGNFGSNSNTAARNFQEQMGITADGIIDPVSWQYLFGYDAYPGSGGMGFDVNKFADEANSCVGKSLASCASYFGVSNPNTDWCAWFVRMCGLKTGLNFGTSNIASQLSGMYGKFSFSSYSPKKGDLAFVDAQRHSGGISVGHVSIVYEVNATKITTINGNWGSSISTSTVKKADYNRSNGYSVAGYSNGSIMQFGKN